VITSILYVLLRSRSKEAYRVSTSDPESPVSCQQSENYHIYRKTMALVVGVSRNVLGIFMALLCAYCFGVTVMFVTLRRFFMIFITFKPAFRKTLQKMTVFQFFIALLLLFLKLKKRRTHRSECAAGTKLEIKAAETYDTRS